MWVKWCQSDVKKSEKCENREICDKSECFKPLNSVFWETGDKLTYEYE